MKKIKLLFLSLLLLSSCSTQSNLSSSPLTSSDSFHTSSNSSQETSQTEPSSSITSSNTSSSSSNINAINSIKKIKQKAIEFKGLENSVGVYESNIYVELELKLLACLDAITTQSGYGDRYKILMSDGEDYIYLKTKYENYSYLKDYVNNQGVYKVKGTISLYNNEVELTVSEKPIYLEDRTLTIDYSNIADSKSISEIYDEINALKLNSKGIAFSKLITLNAKCLAKDINNNNMYFGNDGYIIIVHGHDKVTNKFVKDGSYSLVAAISMHNYRPILEYVYATSTSEVSFNTNNLSVMTCKDFYNYTYKVDENQTYPNYSNLFKKPYLVKGYANAYTKSNKEYLVLEDTYKENLYTSYTNALNAKAIFFCNENYVELTESSYKYCPMYEPFVEGTQLDVIVFPYLWNTQKYPQVYCYSFTNS